MNDGKWSCCVGRRCPNIARDHMGEIGEVVMVVVVVWGEVVPWWS